MMIEVCTRDRFRRGGAGVAPQRDREPETSSVTCWSPPDRTTIMPVSPKRWDSATNTVTAHAGRRSPRIVFVHARQRAGR